MNKEEVSNALHSPLQPVYGNAQLAEMLNVCPKTLEKWRNDGLLGYSQVGRTIMYSLKDIEEFMKHTHVIAYQYERSR